MSETIEPPPPETPGNTPPPAPIAPRTAEPAKPQGLATAALVLALISLVGWLLPIVGIPLSIIGLVLAGCSFSIGKAKAALTICIITLLAGGINAFIGAKMGYDRAECNAGYSYYCNQN